MAPSGGHKGSALALLVDVMSGGVAASNFSHEAQPMGGVAGSEPDVGQVVIAIDPSRQYTAFWSPSFHPRVVSRPLFEGTASVPVFMSMKQPVP